MSYTDPRSILIYTAICGYERDPDFEVCAPNAPTSAQQIACALLTPSNRLRLACEREGIDANDVANCVLHPLKEQNIECGTEAGKQLYQKGLESTERGLNKGTDGMKRDSEEMDWTKAGGGQNPSQEYFPGKRDAKL